MPDPATRVAVDFGTDDPGEHFVLCDLTYTDGRPWECCLRGFLKSALAALEREAGLSVKVGFEHEFHLTLPDAPPPRGYHLRSFRAAVRYAEELVAALDLAGIQIELFHPEYGASQYELSTAPTDGLAAADHAVVLRELTYAVAARRGERVTFAPVVPEMVVGNGVHAHISLLDGDGRPVMHDPQGPASLSETAGRFVAGILRHMPALVAFTAASAVSYRRLVPHRWSASYNNLALHDREAGMRIGAIRENGDVAAQLNVEYRPADAAASPYLLLGAVIMAGLQGMRDQLPRAAADRGRSHHGERGAAEGAGRAPAADLARRGAGCPRGGPGGAGLVPAAAAGGLSAPQARRAAAARGPERGRADRPLRPRLLAPIRRPLCRRGRVATMLPPIPAAEAMSG